MNRYNRAERRRYAKIEATDGDICKADTKVKKINGREDACYKLPMSQPTAKELGASS